LKELHIIFFFRYINIYISISIPDFQFNLADKLMLKKFGILTGEMLLRLILGWMQLGKMECAGTG
jgi:hypothetical protein